jgi:fused signal recognition particle receptor
MFSYLKDKLSGGDEDEGFVEKAKAAVLDTEIDDETFDDLFWELEQHLLKNNVAASVVDTLRDNLRAELVDTTTRRGDIEDTVRDALRESIRDVLKAPKTAFLDQADDASPFVVVLVGVNGSGKTTTAAKLVKHAQDAGKTCVLGAADTYRAAAIQQLEEHGEALDTKVIKHDYGADPAAVAYDTVEHGRSSEKDVCLIDTAGRLHTDANLMEQLSKIVRVAEPHLVLYVAESVTGNDAVNQVKAFNDHVDIDGVIMTKTDADDKGGAVLSVSHVTGSPIYFLGTGQEYNDLEPFSPEDVLDQLGL